MDATALSESQWPTQHKLRHNRVVEQDHRFDAYIEYLRGEGVAVSPKLKCGMFHLRNGLPYPGLYTTQQINSRAQQWGLDCEEILVAVPAKMLLTSYKAEHEAPQQLRSVLEAEAFYHEGPIWQDRILITYLLYSLETSPDSLWSRMATHFSKDIDIISFWEEHQKQVFLDGSVAKAASMERDNFEREWVQFKQIQERHQVLRKGIFTYENYRWIYTHAISRCFGSFMNSTYFTPFCEFFNHNCVDVSYTCLEQHEYDQKLKAESIEQSQETEILSQISSVSCESANSEDYIQQDDFSYDQVPTYIIKWNSKVSFNLKQKEVNIVEKLQSQVIDCLDRELEWRGFNLMYIGEMLQRVNLIGNEYKAERKKFVAAQEELQFMVYHISQFSRAVKNYYKSIGCPPSKKPNTVAPLPEPSEPNTYTKTNKPPSKPYSHLTMTCHSSQHFPAMSEVYFEYGRLSNRTLLLRYGFSLENNKHQHVWIHRRLHKEIGQYPDLFGMMQAKGLPVVWNVKLKAKVLNTELMLLHKVERWKIYGSLGQNGRDFEQMFGIGDLHQEMELIGQVVLIYEQQLRRYQFNQGDRPECCHKFARLSNQDGLVDLTSVQLGYHEYFIAVYHNEKAKILRAQIQMLKLVTQIFSKAIAEKIKIKGNTHITNEIKRIAMADLGCTRAQLKPIWSYLRGLQFSIV